MPPPTTTFRSLLKRLHERGLMTPFAWHFALTVDRMAPGGPNTMPDILFLAAALTAQNTIIQKHVCLKLPSGVHLADFLSADLAPADMRDDLPTADLEPDFLDQLRSDACAFAVTTDTCKGSFKPLVLEGDRLYLHRYWVYEKTLACQLISRAGVKPTAAPDEATIRSCTRLNLDAGQIDAIRKAVANRLCIITGGPGTGKTTIVSVVLTALLKEKTDLKIRLCAPTGKAQARLKEALQAEINGNLNLDKDGSLQNILTALETSTIHRLLKANPSTGHFTFNADNRLTADVLIVDEVSMVDLPLMVKLLTAMPDDCKLILLGDRDQLAAVEIGAALSEMCDAWENKPPVARLTHSHRFERAPGIKQLKDAINTASPEAWNILCAGDDSLALAASPATFDACELALRKQLEGHPFRDYLKAEDAQSALSRFDSFRILCATRDGSCGVNHVNQCMQKLLGVKTYGHGYPVMVTVNDATHRLFNGDIGMCLRGKEDTVRVYFPDFEKPGELRDFSIAELPEHTPVFAMTVHKAQGSGFDEVLMILPPYESPLLTRELVYTALTRAKKRCVVWADQKIFAAAVSHPTVRMSGLAERLRSL